MFAEHDVAGTDSDAGGTAGQCGSRSDWRVARPTNHGMSEGVGFVNTALLEEEHDQPLT